MFAAHQQLASCCVQHVRPAAPRASGLQATTSTSGRHLPAVLPCLRRRWSTVTYAKSNDADYIVAVDPYDSSLSTPMQCDGPTCRGPIFLIAALALGAAWWFKSQVVKPVRREPWPEIPDPNDNPKAYQLALARSRQAVYVQKAVQLMHHGEPSRAMVELHRALDENAICRSPLLDGHQTPDELAALYTLHIKNSEVPPNYSLLLQLREMLGLSRETAEKLEDEVLHSTAAFSI